MKSQKRIPQQFISLDDAIEATDEIPVRRNLFEMKSPDAVSDVIDRINNDHPPIALPPQEPPMQIFNREAQRMYNIRELDVNAIIEPLPSTFMNHGPEVTGSKVVMIGKPKTGKSTLIRSLLYEKKQIFAVGMVFSGTEDSNHAYAEMFPPLYIYNQFDMEAHMRFIKRQRAALAGKLANPWAVYIWDDVVDDKTIFNRKEVKALYKNGRHWKMLQILAMQNSMDLGKNIRGSVDGSFILAENSPEMLKGTWQSFGYGITELTDFKTILAEVTKDRRALYCHNLAGASVEDTLFWYKARHPSNGDIEESFKVGCPEFWRQGTERFVGKRDFFSI